MAIQTAAGISSFPSHLRFFAVRPAQRAEGGDDDEYSQAQGEPHLTVFLVILTTIIVKMQYIIVILSCQEGKEYFFGPGREREEREKREEKGLSKE